MKRTPLARIELVVIAAIVILLPAAITASLGTARNLAKIALCANNLRQIGVAVYEYAQISDGDLPNVAYPLYFDPVRSDETHPYMAYRSDFRVTQESKQLMPYRLACLYEAGLIEDASVFYCPAQTYPSLMFKSYIKPYPPNTSTEWGTLPQQYNEDTGGNQWVRCGYEWFPIDKNPILYRVSINHLPRAPIGLCRRFDNLDPNLPYCFDYLRLADRFSHSYDQVIGVNVLYSDGRVSFGDDPNIFTHRVWDMDPSNRSRPEIMAIYYQRILLLAGQ